jgi:hypothetical protein
MDQILTYFFSISGITIFAIWIGKLFITKSFDAGMEKYKASLQKEIEEYKSDLSRISLEHQIKFSKLHEDRASKIQVLYSKIIDLEQALIYSTTPAQGPEYISDTKRDNDCIEKLKALISQLDSDRIYFSNDLITKFDSIIKESWEIIFQMRKVREYGATIDELKKVGRMVPESYYSKADLWTSAFEKTSNEFKILKENLANEFRTLLGI